MAKLAAIKSRITGFVRKFHSLPKTLRRWGGWTVVGAAFAMLALGEYVFALGLLFIGLLAFSMQILDWRGFTGKPKWTNVLKSLFWLGAGFMLVCFAIVFIRIKGTKEWSNFAWSDLVIVQSNLAYFVMISWYWLLVISAIVFAFLIGRLTKRQGEGEKSGDDGGANQELGVSDNLRGCQDGWLHNLADSQVNKVWELIELLKVGVWRLDLDANIPTIKWGFVIKNNSLFPVSLHDDIRGHMLFEGTKLLEQRTLLTNEVENLGHLRQGTVMFEQRLSKLEAEMIKNNTQGKFNFQGLQIFIKGGLEFGQIKPWQLQVPDLFKVGLDKISDKTSQAIADAIDPITEERDSLKADLEARTAPPGNLVISYAWYGVPGIHQEDVTEILAKMVDGNTLTLKEYYNDFLPDKVQRKRKRLHIDYLYNSIEFSVTVPENARIKLPLPYQDPKQLLRSS